MENNGHSAKVRLSPWHLTWVHIHAKFKDFLNTSAVISKTSFKHQDYQQFRPKQKYQATLAISTNYIKISKGFACNLKRYDTLN